MYTTCSHAPPTCWACFGAYVGSSIAGGVYVAQATSAAFNDVTWDSNRAESTYAADGGGLFIKSDVVTTTVGSGKFEYNTATANGRNGTYARGAAAFAASKLACTSCVFNYNSLEVRDGPGATATAALIGPAGGYFLTGAADYALTSSSFVSNTANRVVSTGSQVS